MRAHFIRPVLTALVLGTYGLAHAGEGDSFFADLNKGAETGATAQPVPTKAATDDGARSPVGSPAASRVDPLGMDALLGQSPDPRQVERPPVRVSNLAAGPDAQGAIQPAVPQTDAVPGSTAAPLPGKVDLDPEPDVAIKPPPRDPLDGPSPQGAGPAPVAPAPSAGPAIGIPLAPLNAAIKAALDKRDAVEIHGANAGERRRERAAVALFYAAHGFAPIWSKGGEPVAAVEPVLARLARADEDALSLAAPPIGLKAEGSPETIAGSEIALTDAVVAYARQATGSRIDPRSISPLIGTKRELADPAEALEAVSAAGADAGDRLRSMNPSEPRYVALREKLIQMRAAHARTAQTIPAGPLLRIGMRDPRVPLIRARFAVEAGAVDLNALEYDTEVAAAVADFQRANGLPASGDLTRRTIAILSRGQPSKLEGSLVANMEMWRWMPRDLGADRIEVDVPSFTVTVFRDGQPVAHNRVVVGKTDTPTPLFSNTMRYLIVNPVWNVPESIIDKEMLPKAGGDPSAMRAKGFTVSYKDGRLLVKQPPGEKNALGRIKFLFPNDYSVYLHDTPSKALFASQRRAFSHGCVRVDQPFVFAESVLNDGVPEGGKTAWSQERLRKMLGDKERTVNLPKPLPIHIEYFTAAVDSTTNRLSLRDDVYDYARKVAVALGHEG